MKKKKLKCPQCGKFFEVPHWEAPKRECCSRSCARKHKPPPRWRPLAERFWEKVARGKADECWEWLGGTTPKGYGRYGVRGNAPGRPHRIAWELTRGEIPEGLYVCHHCDNRLCCNPEHLFLGTHSDNMQDMISKGRKVSPRGSGHYAAKIEECDVVMIQIRKMLGATQRKLASEYGISESNVSHIVNGIAWKHV